MKLLLYLEESEAGVSFHFKLIGCIPILAAIRSSEYYMQ